MGTRNINLCRCQFKPDSITNWCTYSNTQIQVHLLSARSGTVLVSTAVVGKRPAVCGARARGARARIIHACGSRPTHARTVPRPPPPSSPGRAGLVPRGRVAFGRLGESISELEPEGAVRRRERDRGERGERERAPGVWTWWQPALATDPRPSLTA